MAALCRRASGVGRPGVIWRGEIYGADLGRPAGHEPGFVRPALVVSVDSRHPQQWARGPGRRGPVELSGLRVAQPHRSGAGGERTGAHLLRPM